MDWWIVEYYYCKRAVADLIAGWSPGPPKASRSMTALGRVVEVPDSNILYTVTKPRAKTWWGGRGKELIDELMNLKL